MITANVFTRIFFIRAGADSVGTGFTIEVDNRQYLVTARHVVQTLKPPTDIHISRENEWKALPVTTVWRHPSPDIDIAVIPLTLQLSRTLPCLPQSAGLVWGQEVFFLGYPFGQTGERTEANGGYPIAFVRRATFAAGLRDSKGYLLLMLDGHCNPGFSGGPIVFRPQGSTDPRAPFVIGGVIAGYESVPSPVQIPGGTTQMNVLTNTGLVRGFAIDHAVEAARELGTGVPVAAEA
jgi:S1-C subfamily serine protease